MRYSFEGFLQNRWQNFALFTKKRIRLMSCEIKQRILNSLIKCLKLFKPKLLFVETLLFAKFEAKQFRITWNESRKHRICKSSSSAGWPFKILWINYIFWKKLLLHFYLFTTTLLIIYLHIKFFIFQMIIISIIKLKNWKIKIVC